MRSDRSVDVVPGAPELSAVNAAVPLADGADVRRRVNQRAHRLVLNAFARRPMSPGLAKMANTTPAPKFWFRSAAWALDLIASDADDVTRTQAALAEIPTTGRAGCFNAMHTSANQSRFWRKSHVHGAIGMLAFLHLRFPRLIEGFEHPLQIVGFRPVQSVTVSQKKNV